MKFLFVISLLVFFAQFAVASNVSSLSYSGTNVTTSAYVTIVASTPINSSTLVICDNSGQIVKIAVGAAASEVDLFTVPLNACFKFPISPYLASGVRLSLKAISGTANSGYDSVSFLP